MLTKADHERINAAITDAENRTAGEIFCVFSQEVSRYREVPLAWAAIAALALPPLVILSGLHRLALTSFFSSWTEDSAHAMEGLIVRALSAYGLAQAVIFLVVALIVALPGVRRAMTPGFMRRHRVRAAARRHFAAAGAHLAHDHPHVLIFASLHDRRVELVAHEAIHRAVGDVVWNAAVAAVIDGMKAGRPGDGFVKAIELCGAALARHFPPDGAPRNQLPNDILET